MLACDLMQIGRQILGSLIAEQVTHREYKNIKEEIKQSEAFELVLRGKDTSEEFWVWMQGEISRLYYEYYRFAFDTARKAELAMKRELMRPELDATDYIKFNYWDGGRKGLLSGEALYKDARRLLTAYRENNIGEYEIIKNVSVLQVNPWAVLQLRTKRKCTFVLREELWDGDTPGHYCRRIWSVAASMFLNKGPYTSVNCRLTLLKSSIRKNSQLKDGSYRREGAEDDRFIDYFGSLESIVTSTAQNDEGRFSNQRDEHYLRPFEGSGVISEWQLEWLAAWPQCDPDTISDVILHVRFTAREGGELLRAAANANLKELVETAGSVRLFSLRHEFPTEWARFKSIKPVGPTIELKFNIREEHYPFWSQGMLKDAENKQVHLIAKTQKAVVVKYNAAGIGDVDNLAKDDTLGGLYKGKLAKIPLSKPIGEIALYFEDNSMEHLWLAITWSA
jgi:hypothetical protein